MITGVDDAPNRTPQNDSTTLRLRGAPGARDLGALLGAPGRIFRSSALVSLTDGDLGVLATHRLATVIDLRSAGERQTLGADRLPPTAQAPRLVELPVYDPSLAAFAILGPPDRHADGTRPAELLPHGGAEHAMTDLYRAFVARPALRDAFGQGLRLLADPLARPVLFHCTAGKDRTGWLAAMTLTACGMSREEVLTDYLKSNDCMGVHVKAALESLAARHGIKDSGLLRPLTEARPEYLQAAFDEADRQFGSFAAFLSEGTGLDSRSLRRLQANLRNTRRTD
jgi:protein-tyrosine phosphatase